MKNLIARVWADAMSGSWKPGFECEIKQRNRLTNAYIKSHRYMPVDELTDVSIGKLDVNKVNTILFNRKHT